MAQAGHLEPEPRVRMASQTPARQRRQRLRRGLQSMREPMSPGLEAVRSPGRLAALPRSPERTAAGRPQSAVPAAVAAQFCAAQPRPQPVAQTSARRAASAQASPPRAGELVRRREQPDEDSRQPPQPLPCGATARELRRRASKPATSLFLAFAHYRSSDSATRCYRGCHAANRRVHARPHRSRANSNGSFFRLRQLPSEHPGSPGS